MKFPHCSQRRLLSQCALPDLEYQADPYIGCNHLCHYCYALNKAETDWAEEILVYGDIAGQLAHELEGIPPQTIYMGWETDPYQPCESDLKQTRQVLELLQSRGFSASILTKSNLVLRDLDILTAMPDARISFSLAFEDEALRQLFEGNTMPTQVRIAALRECKKAGLTTSAMICPVIPYVNDPFPLIEAASQHVDRAWVYGLSIMDETEVNWSNVEALLRGNYPDTHEAIKAAIFDREHPFWAELRNAVNERYASCGFELNVRI